MDPKKLIIEALNLNYNIGEIKEIISLDLSFKKNLLYKKHFLVITSYNKYFVKLYNLDQLDLLNNELEGLIRFKNHFNIPKIIFNKEEKTWLRINNSLLSVFEYINGEDLIKNKTKKEDFFSMLNTYSCDLFNYESKDLGLYSFIKHFHNFDLNIKKINKKINDNLGINDVYLNFFKYQIDEVERLKDFYLNLKIEEHYIHGDILMQNIIKDEKDILWLLDWEKCRKGISVSDIFRSIMFTLINSKKEDLGLDPEEYSRWAIHCMRDIAFSKEEIENACNLFYLYLITKTQTLERVAFPDLGLDENLSSEDVYICKWFKENMKFIQDKINQAYLYR